MKIADLRLATRFIPFRQQYGISSASFTGETFLIAELVTEEGAVGLADSVNAVPFGSESPETMTEVLMRHLLPAVWGLDARDTGLLAARMEAEAAALAARGAHTIKVKIDTDPATDLERVRAIRAAVGPRVKLRLDANQGCGSDWLPAFRRMEAAGLEFLEQPLPVRDVAGTARLAAALDTPILIEEGVYTPEDLMALIRAGAVGAVNIKVLKTGLTGARAIAAIAAAAGLPVVVGSMFETGIGTAAGLHFAASLPAGPIPCTECLFPLLLAEDVTEGAPWSQDPGTFRWPLPPGPGLGVGRAMP